MSPLLALLPSLLGACPDYNPQKNVYFGDLHVHTSYSLDAYGFGTRNDPGDAFRFAKGQPLTLAGGAQVSIPRLNFSIVSDHSEMFDIMGECVWPHSTAEGTLYYSSYCTRARELLYQYGAFGNPWPLLTSLGGDPPVRPNVQTSTGTAWLCAGGDESWCALARGQVWQRQVNWANLAQEQCTFTTFPAYEWSATPAVAGTAQSLTNATLHRIVLFGGSTVPATPLDSIAYPTPLSMLSSLDQQCRAEQGCQALAIPHNPNQSKGLAFVLDLQANGTEGSNSGLESLYRTRYERLVEVFQHKGNSECLFVDPGDQGYDVACGYENTSWNASTADKQQDLPGYARSGLTKGLRWHASGAGNPFQFGLVGATDTHNATPGNVSESAFPGHLGYNDATAASRMKNSPAAYNPGGLTAVWAEENTRASLFSALQRREVYATSGPRMVVRFYQTWDQTTNFCADPNFPAQLLAAGAVPMGSTMPARPNGTARPRFIAYAAKDQALLQELSLIKVSIANATAPTQQELRRQVSSTGQSTWCHTWTDDTYSATAPAYYYARVLEQPTWRYSHYDCEALKGQDPSWATKYPGCVCTPPPGGAIMCGDPTQPSCLDCMQRERAWTSPVWHLP
jgi:hypothetical protein